MQEILPKRTDGAERGWIAKGPDETNVPKRRSWGQEIDLCALSLLLPLFRSFPERLWGISGPRWSVSSGNEKKQCGTILFFWYDMNHEAISGPNRRLRRAISAHRLQKRTESLVLLPEESTDEILPGSGGMKGETCDRFDHWEMLVYIH